MGRLGLVVALLCAGACIQSSLVPCGDQLCPIGTECVAGALCATRDQIAACDGLADGEACTTGGGAGVCDRGVCVRTGCGNGAVEVGEGCDDGNQTGGDGCSADCSKVEMCGDAFVDDGEACDDGNSNVADGCDACAQTVWRASSVLGDKLDATNVDLYGPTGIAFDRLGNLYIADTRNARVRRVDRDGVIVTIAGDGTGVEAGDGGPATSASLQGPSNIAVDGLGNVYIADDQYVRRVDAGTGIITTIAGSGGTLGPSGDGGPATTAAIQLRGGIVIDGLGNLYISERDRIRRIDTDGIITTIAGGAIGSSGDGGPATAALLSAPIGLAFDHTGALYIADSGNNRVRRIVNGVITTIVGTTQGFSGDGGTALAAQLHAPASVAVDDAGNLFIADVGNYRVRRVDTAGIISTVAGSDVAIFSGDGGLATATGISPTAIALDATGLLYIAEADNQRVRALDSANIITTVAGTGHAGYIGEGNAATSTNVQAPVALAVSTSGDIYVTDTNGQRVFRMDPSGVVTIVAGNGVYGSDGAGGPATLANLAYPWGVATDAGGNVYVADAENNRILRVDSQGMLTMFAGTGSYGSSGDGGPATSALLGEPLGVAVRGSDLYIADTYNNRIRRVNSSGVITTIAGTGTFGSTGDGGPATSATIGYPSSLAFDAAGNLYFGDVGNYKVRMISTTGTISTIAGTGTFGYTGDGGAATSADLSEPYSVAVDAAGNVYVADRDNNVIRRITQGSGIITTVAGTGVQGYAGDGGPAVQATLDFPFGLAVDAGGNIYLADNNLRVRRIDTSGIITSVFGNIDPEYMGPAAAARLANPQALSVTATLTLIAGGISGTVQAVRSAPSWLEVVIGRYPHDEATANLARFRDYAFGTISGVAVDAPAGKIYITESDANRLHVVTVVDPADENTWTIAPLTTDTTAGFSNGALATARFRNPTGLYVDTATKQLYVADTGNHVIRAIDLTAGTVRTVAGIATTRGFFGDGGAAASALLYEPRALTRCANGDLFIADTSNDRVRRVTASGTISTVLGDGVAASSGDGAPASAFPVDSPLGLACDGIDNLFVTSRTTVRMLIADANGVVDGTGPVQTIYGAPPRDAFPASATSCLTGIAAVDATRVQVTDSCTGLLVELRREALP